MIPNYSTDIDPIKLIFSRNPSFTFTLSMKFDHIKLDDFCFLAAWLIFCHLNSKKLSHCNSEGGSLASDGVHMYLLEAARWILRTASAAPQREIILWSHMPMQVHAWEPGRTRSEVWESMQDFEVNLNKAFGNIGRAISWNTP